LIVLAGGWLLLLAGLVAIAHMAAPAALRLTLAALWLAEAGRSLWALGRAHRRIRYFSMGAEGTGRATGRGSSSRLRLLPGSLLLPGGIWLLLETDDDLRYGELVLARDMTSRDWRRLNVFWRHGRLQTTHQSE